MTAEVVERRPKPAPPVGRWDRAVAWFLLAVIAVMLGCAALLGEREVQVSELRGAIAAGDVSEVRMSAETLGGTGYEPVTIRWEEHGLSYVTSVTQASNDRQARKVPRPADEVVVGDVAEALTTNGRAVTVVGSTSDFYSGTHRTLLGFTTPGWIAAVGVAVLCATLLLIGSIEPWRATRWAWAWFVLLTPIGVPLFLLLGGLTGLLRPRPGSYRLTGGWAFLLAAAIGGALG